MSDIISLAEDLLARGRLMVRLGRTADAHRLLRRLLVQPNLTNASRVEAHRLLAGIDSDAGRFRRARRLLAAAIRLHRFSAELYIEYARAVEADPKADPRLAVKALRQVVRLDTYESRSWAALGSAALRAGDNLLARRSFRRAARLRPESIDVMRQVVDGFQALGCANDARKFLVAARFRSPNDPGIMAICDRLQFAEAIQRQRRTNSGDEATILQFPVRESKAANMDPHAVVLRADRKSVSKPHLLRLFGNRSGPRQAQ